MLGIECQPIYCDVKKCQYNEKQEILNIMADEVIETYHICKREDIYIDSAGKCKEGPMTAEEKEKLVKALLKSEEIKNIYDNYIIKEIPFETWVRNVTERLLGTVV